MTSLLCMCGTLLVKPPSSERCIKVVCCHVTFLVEGHCLTSAKKWTVIIRIREVLTVIYKVNNVIYCVYTSTPDFNSTAAMSCT